MKYLKLFTELEIEKPFFILNSSTEMIKEDGKVIKTNW